jgi:hypothetical protein
MARLRWLVLALLATVGPGISVRRLARRPLRTQVRLTGQIEAVGVLMLVTTVPVLALGLLGAFSSIEVPAVWLVATCAVTCRLSPWRTADWRARARRSDPEWWE